MKRHYEMEFEYKNNIQLLLPTTSVFTNSIIYNVSQILIMYIYIYIYYGDVTHQRCRQVYIYAYTPVCGFVCIIYTSGPLHSSGERFISTNSGFIIRDRYRVTKFLAKMTFILFTGVNLSICTPANNRSVW